MGFNVQAFQGKCLLSFWLYDADFTEKVGSMIIMDLYDLEDLCLKLTELKTELARNEREWVTIARKDTA